MSYICIVSSREGAVAAADSRITIDTPIPAIHFHRDNGRKVFASPDRELIWACDGVTRRGLLHYPTMVKTILCRKSLPVEERIHRASHALCRVSRRHPWAKSVPFLNRLLAEDCVFNLLYAYPAVSPAEDGSGFITGLLAICNGKVLQDCKWNRPVILENGMNMNLLTPLSRYTPRPDASLSELQKLARKRVHESIEKDRRLLAADSRYRATIGGRIRSVSLSGR